MKKFFLVLTAFLTLFHLSAQELSDYTVSVGNTTYSTIASTGTQLMNVYGDYANQTFAMPFSFEFGLQSVVRGTTVRVRSDGHILLNLNGDTYSGSDFGYNYWPVNNSYSYCAIVPYTCDDGYMPSNTSAVYWQVEETVSGDSVLIIEFVDVEHYVDNGGQFNYQLRIFQNGDVSVTYGPMTGSSSYANFMMTANSLTDRVLLTGSWLSPAVGNPAQMSYLSEAPIPGTVITYTRPTLYCSRPLNLSDSAVTDVSAVLFWESNPDIYQYTYEYDVTDFVPGQGLHNEGSTMDTFVHLSGLSGQSTYYFYVKGDCNNGAGSNYARFVFTTDCGHVTSFPWTESFENPNALDCWTTLDLDNHSFSNWGRYSGSSYAHSGSYSVRSGYNTNAPANDWLITPPVDIPASAYGYSLRWYVRGSTFSSNVSHYTVLVSTTGNAASDFVDTLYAESYGNAVVTDRSVNLDAYAGQTIYVAFIHDSQNDNSIFFDDISVYCALPPEVAITGPTLAFEGDNVVFYGIFQGGSTAGLQFDWYSTMSTNGYASLVSLGDSVEINYMAGGMDTIRLVATNMYGTDTATFVVRVCGTIVTLPWEENFENAAALDCWTILDLDSVTSNNWTRYSGSSNAHSGNYCMRSSFNSNAAANDWLVTSPVEIPYGAEGVYLKWFVKGSSYSSYMPHYTVRLSTTGNDAADFVDSLFAESYSGGYVQRMVNLDAYAGSTLYLAFVHDSYNDNGLYLDDIGIFISMSPVVSVSGPEIAFTGMDAVFHAQLSEGSVTGLQYDWTSMMATAGQAMLTSFGDSVALNYTSGGMDIIQLVATNSYGSDTATFVVRVCGSVANLPWTESFETPSSIDCWTILDLDNSTNDNWSRYNSISYAHTGNYSMRSNYNSSSAANDWLVTPPLEIPANAEGLALSWFVRGTTFSSNQSHYRVLLSTTGNSISDFTDSLFAESYSGNYVQRVVDLEPYAGQTVLVAFVHDSYNDNGLYIDDVSLRFVLEPVVSLSAPSMVFTGDTVTLAATLQEGSPNGLTYTWSSSLGGTITPAGNSATILYTVGGTDTVQVIASNVYGADTAIAVITVVDCSPVTSFPWSEDFESGNSVLQCWTIVDNNNYSADNWVLSNDPSYAYSGNYALRGSYNNGGTCDDYIISPAIVVPANATDLWLSYYVRGGDYYGNSTSYRTLVSTTGTNISDFTQVLANETYAGAYDLRLFPLSAYAGQTIYIAFHQTSYDAGNMYIDDITIGDNPSCDNPVITSVSPDATTVTVSWTGDANHYSVAIISGTWSEPSNPVPVNGFTYTFTGLDPETTYTIGVQSNCDNGNNSEWTTQSATTLALPCTVPVNLNADNVTFSNAEISWNPTEAISYEVCYGVNITTSTGTVITTQTNHLNLTSLDENTTYDVFVRSVCASNHYSDWSEKLQFTTLIDGIADYAVADMQVYPNPASTQITVRAAGIRQVEVLDVRGRVLLNQYGDGSDEIKQNVERLTPGVYLIRVTGEKGQGVSRVIIER